MKLVLTCPVCGHAHWIADPDHNGDGYFQCKQCKELSYPEEMTVKREEDVKETK
jgi:hypothetical protein